MDSMLVVDDEPLALRDLVAVVREAGGPADPAAFRLPREALAWASRHRVDVAFLDIEMPGMNGIELARRIKGLWPEARIVFMTSYEHYALEAFQVHATGYLLKPARVEEVRRELAFMYGERPCRRGVLRARMFGGFEVEVDGRPLIFRRSKAKELLALLIDARGMSLTAREARALLWEDEPASRSQASYYRSVVADLRQALAEAGAPQVLVRTRASVAIDSDWVEADSWRVLDGDPVALSTCRGAYLPAYAWAEGRLERWGLAP